MFIYTMLLQYRCNYELKLLRSVELMMLCWLSKIVSIVIPAMSNYMAFGTVTKVDRQRVKIETADHREFHFSAGQFEVGQQLLYRWDDLRVYLVPGDYIQMWLAADKKSVTSAHSIVQCQDGMYVGVVDCVLPPVGSDPRLGNIWSSPLGNIPFQLRYQFKVGDRVKFKWELNNNDRMKLAEPVILQ